MCEYGSSCQFCGKRFWFWQSVIWLAGGPAHLSCADEEYAEEEYV